MYVFFKVYKNVFNALFEKKVKKYFECADKKPSLWEF